MLVASEDVRVSWSSRARFFMSLSSSCWDLLVVVVACSSNAGLDMFIEWKPWIDGKDEKVNDRADIDCLFVLSRCVLMCLYQVLRRSCITEYSGKGEV